MKKRNKMRAFLQNMRETFELYRLIMMAFFSELVEFGHFNLAYYYLVPACPVFRIGIKDNRLRLIILVKIATE